MRLTSSMLALAALATSGLAMPAACTLLLGTDAVQCTDSSSCTRFPSSVCDVTNGVCVPRPTVADAGRDDLMSSEAADAGPSDQSGPTDIAPAERLDLVESIPSAGDGGGPPPDRRPLTGCPDLDQNSVEDCRESLVINPDFTSDGAGWKAELGVTQTAPGLDPGNPASGALAVANTNQSTGPGSSMAGSMQCLTARAATAYVLYAEVSIPLDQDPSTLAGVALQSYATPDCSGPQSAFVTPSLIAASGASVTWQVVQLALPIPAGSASVSVRLVVVKSFAKRTAEALFDNVLLRAQAEPASSGALSSGRPRSLPESPSPATSRR